MPGAKGMMLMTMITVIVTVNLRMTIARFAIKNVLVMMTMYFPAKEF